MIRFLLKNFCGVLFILLFTLSIFSSSDACFAQANFSVVCPQKKIGKNDYLQLQFKVANASNVETIIPPSFKNFSIVSGPNQESGMTSVNGKVDQYVSIGYFLKPKAPGNYTIGSAVARADGKEYHSSPITVEVTNAATPSNNNSSASAFGNSLSSLGLGNMSLDFPAQPQPHRFDDYILKKGEDINTKVEKNLFIKLDVDKTTCFVGEPVVASYKLYTRLRSESTITNAPSFNGFSVSEMDVNNNNSSGTEKYNGRDYNVYTLRKVQLYPLQDGTVTLDPVVSDNKITFIKAEYAGAQNGNNFYDMMQNFADATSPQDAIIEKHVTLQSKPVVIIVKPLPVENKPAGFKGAVGNFTVQSSLQKNNITTDDAGNLKIILSGAGNIQLINAPKINWPAGIDGYEAKVSDAIDKSSVPMKGDKTFMYPFTVSKAGTYTIPSVSFSFFDPSTSAYKEVSTNPLAVTVTKGKGIPKTPYALNNITDDSTGENLLSKYGVYLALIVLLFAAGVFFAVQKNNKKIINPVKEVAAEKEKQQELVTTQQPEFTIPESPLKDAHDKLMEENSSGFYSVLDASFKKYLSTKFKIPVEELTKKRLYEELDKCNVGLGTSHLLSSLIEDVELNLYAPPSSTNHLKETYEKASEVVSLLDKQVC